MKVVMVIVNTLKDLKDDLREVKLKRSWIEDNMSRLELDLEEIDQIIDDLERNIKRLEPLKKCP